MSKVSIVRTANEILESVSRCIDYIGGIAEFVKPNDYILLKPNVNGTEAVTDVNIVESLIVLLKEHNVRKMAIAESTFGDENMTDLCFKKTGYMDIAEKHGIPILNLNRSRAVDVKVINPMITDKIRIAEEIFEADLIINIPVMKVHYATAVTLSMKNLKGLLVKTEKRRFHEIGLDKAIVDLNNSIAPTLNLIDCTVCMERMGPKGGDPIALDLLIAGHDRGEVDYVGSQVMGFTVDEVKHLKYYLENRKTDTDNIEIVGEDINNVKHMFVKAQIENCVPSSFKVHNINACSSCENAFLLSCQILDDTPRDEASIVMGDVTYPSLIGNNFKIGFGNCSKKIQMHYDANIVGCPPYPFALKKLFKSLKREKQKPGEACEE